MTRFYEVYAKNMKEGRPDMKPWYDVVSDYAVRFVIRAKGAREARKIAADNCGDEGKEAWLNTRYSLCVPLRSDAKTSRLICRDYVGA